jgi:hypothetical protein
MSFFLSLLVNAITKFPHYKFWVLNHKICDRKDVLTPAGLIVHTLVTDSALLPPPPHLITKYVITTA